MQLRDWLARARFTKRRGSAQLVGKESWQRPERPAKPTGGKICGGYNHAGTMCPNQTRLEYVGAFRLVACGITCSRTGNSRTGGEADDIAAACDGLDAYGNTLILTGPGADGAWFTDDDLQSSHGGNEIIYCGYRYDPETELYYTLCGY